MDWWFRFRSKFRFEEVRLQTFSDDEAEAREVAMKHLESINGPPSAFVSVHRRS